MPSSFSEIIRGYRRVADEVREREIEVSREHARRVEDFNNTWNQGHVVYSQPPIDHRVWEVEPDSFGIRGGPIPPQPMTVSRRSYRVPTPVPTEMLGEDIHNTTKGVPDIAILFSKEKNLCLKK